MKRCNIGVQCRRDKTLARYITSEDMTSAFSCLLPKIRTSSIPLLHPALENLKYARFMRVEVYPNGGASVVHMYQDEIDSLQKTEIPELASEFFKVCSNLSTYSYCLSSHLSFLCTYFGSELVSAVVTAYTLYVYLQ